MAISNRKNREKKRRENEIIDAAEQIFAKGFHNATMDKVAECAEVSKGALYLHFKSKNELCLAITLRALKIIESKIEEIKVLSVKGIDKIISIFEVLNNIFSEYPIYFKSLSNYLHYNEECNKESKIFQKTVAVNLNITEIIQNILNQGQKDGSIDMKIDTEKTAYSLWGNMSGIIPSCFITGVNSKVDLKYTNKQILEQTMSLIKTALINNE